MASTKTTMKHICTNLECYTDSEQFDGELKRYIDMQLWKGTCVPYQEIATLKGLVQFSKDEYNKKKALCYYSSASYNRDDYEYVHHTCEKNETCVCVVTEDGEWGAFRERCDETVSEIVIDGNLIMHPGGPDEDAVSSFLYEKGADNATSDHCISLKYIQEEILNKK